MNITIIEYNDFSKIENIGHKCLPIYYKIADLYYLLLDKNYICLKNICQTCTFRTLYLYFELISCY